MRVCAAGPAITALPLATPPRPLEGPLTHQRHHNDAFALHLDSPLLGLASKSEAFARRVAEASRQAFDNLIDLAIAEECRFVIFAGDVFDGDLRNLKAGLFFVDRLRRLHEAGIKVFMVLGSHISSTLRCASRSSRRLDGTRFR